MIFFFPVPLDHLATYIQARRQRIFFLNYYHLQSFFHEEVKKKKTNSLKGTFNLV